MTRIMSEEMKSRRRNLGAIMKIGRGEKKKKKKSFSCGLKAQAYQERLKHDKKCRAVEHIKLNGKWGPSLFDYFADLQL